MTKNKNHEAMWQAYFKEHAYLEQTAGWQLALEGVLREALDPVAFPDQSLWQDMTKDGLPLLQHADLQDRITAAAAEAFPRVISQLLTSEALVMPDVMRQALCGMEHLKGAQNVFAALCRQDDASIRSLAETHAIPETSLRLFGWAVLGALVPEEAKMHLYGKHSAGSAITVRSAAGHLSWLSCARSSRAARASSSVTAATRSGRTRALAASTAATRTSRR